MIPTIILDLDATLNDMEQQIYNLFLDQYDLDIYERKENLPFSLEQIHRLIEKHELHYKTVPLKGAYELFQAIRNQGYEIGILTGRKCFFNESDNVTTDWLKLHRLEPDWLEIMLGNKLIAIEAKKVDCVLFLDDESNHLIQVSEAKVAKYVGTISYHYNQNLPSSILVFNNLEEVRKFVLTLPKI